MDDRGVLPEVEGANEAVNNGHLEILKWMNERDVVPNGACYVVDHDNYHVLEWVLEHHGISPGVFGANWAAQRGHLQALKWIAKHDTYPDECGALWAAQNGHCDVLIWLAEHDIVPVIDKQKYIMYKPLLSVLRFLSIHEHFN